MVINIENVGFAFETSQKHSMLPDYHMMARDLIPLVTFRNSLKHGN